jgi:hypothetical protein
MYSVFAAARLANCGNYWEIAAFTE